MGPPCGVELLAAAKIAPQMAHAAGGLILLLASGEVEVMQAMDAIQDLLFNLLGINSEYVELEWGRFKDSSGDYDSCKVFAKEPVVNKLYNLFIPKGSYVYIVNTSKCLS